MQDFCTARNVSPDDATSVTVTSVIATADGHEAALAHGCHQDIDGQLGAEEERTIGGSAAADET